MRKIKVMIASMFGAIALVFACVFGTRINAATENGLYTLDPTEIWTSTSNADPTDGVLGSDGVTYTKTAGTGGIFSVSYKADKLKCKKESFGARATAQSQTLTNNTGKTWTNEVLMGGSRTININLDLSANQRADIVVYGYFAKSASSISLGGTSVTPTINTISSTEVAKTVSGSTTFVSATNYALLEIDVNVYSVTTYTVSFNNNGGTGSISSQSVVSGSYATEPATNPTYSGHSFTGWYTSEDNGVTLSDNTFDFATTAITGDITLFAGWETANTANVTFQSSTYEDNVVIEAVDGTILSWPENPFKEGYVFDGWYSGETKYTQNNTYNSDITLTAQFTKSVLSVGLTYVFNPSNISISGKAAATSSDGYYFINNTDTSKGVRTSGSTFTVGNGLDSTTSLNYLGFTIPANSYVVINLTAKRATDSDSSKYARLYFNGENASTGNLTTDYADYSVIYYNNSNTDNLVKMYRNGNKTVTISGLSIAVYSSVVTEIEAQSRGTGTAIRFAATLTNVGSLDVVTKWNYTLSMDGKTDVVSADKTVLYTAISGTNGKAAADNTYYIVLTIQNVPATYNGKDLKCKFTITLSDGSTIETDVVAETINVSVSE